MFRHLFENNRLVIWVIVMVGVIALITYEQAKPATPKMYVLPSDNFNQDGIKSIGWTQ